MHWTRRFFRARIFQQLSSPLPSHIGRQCRPEEIRLLVEQNPSLRKRPRLSSEDTGGRVTIRIEVPDDLAGTDLERDIVLPLLCDLLGRRGEVGELQDRFDSYHRTHVDYGWLGEHEQDFAKQYAEINAKYFGNWLPDFGHVIMTEKRLLKTVEIYKLDSLYVIYLPPFTRGKDYLDYLPDVAGSKVMLHCLDCLSAFAAFLVNGERLEVSSEVEIRIKYTAYLKLREEQLEKELSFAQLANDIRQHDDDSFKKTLQQTEARFGKTRPVDEVQRDILKLETDRMSVGGVDYPWPKDKYPKPPGGDGLRDKIMFDHPKPSARAAHARATTVTAEIQLLANDEFPQVRAAVAENRCCPPPVLEKLASDLHPLVLAGGCCQ